MTTTKATLLAHHPHKQTVGQSLHKTAAQASAIIHGPNHEGLTALVFVVFVAVLLYAIKITFFAGSKAR